MKQIFIKITGVTPKELAALHSLYDDGLHQKSSHRVFWQGRTKSGYSAGDVGHPSLISVVSSKLDGSHATYTVELCVDAVTVDVCPPDAGSPAGVWELRASESLLKRIWDALGIFPPEEQFVKVRN